MLEQLDTIDWFQFGHAYGDASDVPRMLRGLLSPDEKTRRDSLDQLCGSVRHQGDIYDSTPQVVPFLIELIAEPTTPDRAYLLENFCHFAPDYRYWAPYRGEKIVEDEFRRQTRLAIEAGLPVYRRLLNDAEDGVRIGAARMLTVCFAERDLAADSILERVRVESVADVRALLVLLTAVFRRSTDVTVFANLAAHEVDPAVRLAAALAWVVLDGPAEEAVRILESCAQEPEDLFGRYPKYDSALDEALIALGNHPAANVRVGLQLRRHLAVERRKDALGWLTTGPPFSAAGVAAVAESLSDPVAEVRQWAAYQLGSLGDGKLFFASIRPEATAGLESALDQVAPLAVAALRERLPIEEDSDARHTICRALGDLALWAVPAVSALEAFAQERDAQNALHVIRTLRQGSPSERLQLFGGPKVQWMADRSLLRAGPDEAGVVVTTLCRALEESAETGVRPWAFCATRAAKLLGELGSAARAAVPALERVLNSEHLSVRDAAEQALRAIAPELPQPKSLPDEEELRAILGDDAPDDLPALVLALIDDANAQRAALWDIAKLGAAAKPAEPFVREAMNKPWLYYDAAGALSRIDPEFVRPRIPEFLRRFGDDLGRGGANERTSCFLAYLGPELQPDAVRYLLKCLPQPGGEAKRRAYLMAGSLGFLESAKPKVLLPLVIRLLKLQWDDEGEQLCGVSDILKFLKRRGRPYAKATDAVLAKLASPKIVPLVLRTLSRIGSWSAVAPHWDPFLAGDNAVREAAEECVERLGKAAKKADLPALQEARKHRSEVVRQAAGAAVKRLTPGDTQSR